MARHRGAGAPDYGNEQLYPTVEPRHRGPGRWMFGAWIAEHVLPPTEPMDALGV